MNVTISLIQMDVRIGRGEENLAKAISMLEEAKERGSDLAVLPELWWTGYDLANAERDAHGLDEGAFVEMANLARKYSLYLMGSSMGWSESGRPTNRLAIFGPEGQLLAHYDKVHLFQGLGEHTHLEAGTGLSLVEMPWGQTGLGLCYDLRFPELFRSYALAGATMVALSAQWPRPRVEHWRILLRARAIENQSFVVACNRMDGTDSLNYFGHSTILAPWGEVVAEGGEEEEVVTGTIDTDRLEEVRSMMPVFEDRRPEAYHVETEARMS